MLRHLQSSLFPWKHSKTKVMASARTTTMPVEEQPVVVHQELFPCEVCGRTFAAQPLQKHRKVCEKSIVKKRKVFDSLKQRVEGTDLAPFHQKSYLKKHTQDPPNLVVAQAEAATKVKKSRWKEKHLELVKAIRAAKGVSSDMSAKRSSATSLTVSPANERCPSCDRQFGPKAFDRHVEWCKERKSRIQKSPASVLIAKERLEARIKYKVPPLKPRRALTREKYASSPDAGGSVRSAASSVSLDRRSPAGVRKASKSVVDVKKGGAGEVKREKSPPGKKTDVCVQPTNNKSSHATNNNKRKPNQLKLNKINVNNDVQGMTVCPLTFDGKKSESEEKNMITWKDTLTKQSDKKKMKKFEKPVVTEEFLEDLKINQNLLKGPKSRTDVALAKYKISEESLDRNLLKENESLRSKTNIALRRNFSEKSIKKLEAKSEILVKVDELRTGMVQKSENPGDLIDLIDDGEIETIDICSKCSNGLLEKYVNPLSDCESAPLTIKEGVNLLQFDTDDEFVPKRVTNEMNLLMEKPNHEFIAFDNNDLDDVLLEPPPFFKNDTPPEEELTNEEKSNKMELIEKLIEALDGDDLGNLLPAAGDHMRLDQKFSQNFEKLVGMYQKMLVEKKNGSRDVATSSSLVERNLDEADQLNSEISILVDEEKRVVNVQRSSSGDLQGKLCSKSPGKSGDQKLFAPLPSKMEGSFDGDLKGRLEESFSSILPGDEKPYTLPPSKVEGGSDDDLQGGLCSKSLQIGSSKMRAVSSEEKVFIPTLARAEERSDDNCPEASPKFISKMSVKSGEKISSLFVKEGGSSDDDIHKKCCTKPLPKFDAKTSTLLESKGRCTPPSTKLEGVSVNEFQEKLPPKSSSEFDSNVLVASDENKPFHLSLTRVEGCSDNYFQEKLRTKSSPKFDSNALVASDEEKPFHLSLTKEEGRFDDYFQEKLRTKSSPKFESNVAIVLSDDKMFLPPLTKLERSSDDDLEERSLLKCNSDIERPCTPPSTRIAGSSDYDFQERFRSESSPKFNSEVSIVSGGEDSPLTRMGGSSMSILSVDEKNFIPPLSNVDDDFGSKSSPRLNSKTSIVLCDEGNLVLSGRRMEGGSDVDFQRNISYTSLLNFNSKTSIVLCDEKTPTHSSTRMEKRFGVDCQQNLDCKSLTELTALCYEKSASARMEESYGTDSKQNFSSQSSPILISEASAGDKILVPPPTRTGGSSSRIPKSGNAKTRSDFPKSSPKLTSKTSTAGNKILVPPPTRTGGNSGRFPSKLNSKIRMSGDAKTRSDFPKSSPKLTSSTTLAGDKILTPPPTRTGENSSRIPMSGNAKTGSDFKEEFRTKSTLKLQSIMSMVSDEENTRLPSRAEGNSEDSFPELISVNEKLNQELFDDFERHIPDGKPLISPRTDDKFNIKSCFESKSELNLIVDNFEKLTSAKEDTDTLLEPRDWDFDDLESLTGATNKWTEALSMERLNKGSLKSSHSDVCLLPHYETTKSQRIIVNVPSVLDRKASTSAPPLLVMVSSSEIVPQKKRKMNHYCEYIEDTLNANIDRIKQKKQEETVQQEVVKKERKKKKKKNVACSCDIDLIMTPRFKQLLNFLSLNSDRNEDEILTVSRKQCLKLLSLNAETLDGGVKLPEILGNKPYSNKRKEAKRNEIKLPPLTLKKRMVNPIMVVGENFSDNNTEEYNPFVSAERQLMELLQCDDFKPFTPRPHTTDTVKRSSVIDPPSQFEDKLLALNDNFELIESFISDNFSSFANNNEKNLHLNNNRRKYSDDMSSIDPKLINENDDLSIPDHLISDYSDTDPFSLQYDKNISAFEPIVPKTEIINDLKRSVSLIEPNETVVDFGTRLSKPKTALAKVNSFRKKQTATTPTTIKSTGSIINSSSAKGVGDKNKKANTTMMKRSLSMADPVGKPRNFRNREEVHDYFSGKEKKNGRASPEKELSLSPTSMKTSNPFAIDDEMFEEYRKYEEMYLQEKQQKLKNPQRPGDVNSNEDDDGLTNNGKINNDSAYSSLKTSKVRARSTKLSPLQPQKLNGIESPSSSGSEMSPSSPCPPKSPQRVSRFCHECGSKYPLSCAKFCVECGVKRLVL